MPAVKYLHQYLYICIVCIKITHFSTNVTGALSVPSTLVRGGCSVTTFTLLARLAPSELLRVNPPTAGSPNAAAAPDRGDRAGPRKLPMSTESLFPAPKLLCDGDGERALEDLYEMDDCLLALPFRKPLIVGLSGVDGPTWGEYGDVVWPSSAKRGEPVRAGEPGADPIIEPPARCKGRGPRLLFRLECRSLLVAAAADDSARLAKWLNADGGGGGVVVAELLIITL